METRINIVFKELRKTNSSLLKLFDYKSDLNTEAVNLKKAAMIFEENVDCEK